MSKKFIVRRCDEYNNILPIILEGSAQGRRILTSKETGSEKMMLGICTIMPGDNHGWHTHPPNEEEINYVIEGRGLIKWLEGDAKKECEVTAGDVIFTPENVPNMQLNIGNGPFRFVYVISPPRE